MMAMSFTGTIASEWHVFASDRRMADEWTGGETPSGDVAGPQDESGETGYDFNEKGE